MTLTFVANRPQKNPSFSSDALEVVNEIKSTYDPLGWFSRDSILCSKALFLLKGWELSWEARTTSQFADYIAKKVIASNCNVLFSSFNLDCVLKDLKNIYAPNLMESIKV